MIDLNEVERRAQAEVLAACIGALEEKRAHHERLARINQDKGKSTLCSYDERYEYHYAVALKTLRQLQPAAFALEKLLRQAEIKGRLKK